MELIGQDVESFIGNRNDNVHEHHGESEQSPSTSSTTSRGDDHTNNVAGLLLPGILNQLLGTESLNAPTSLSVLSQQDSGNRRPIGFVFRQTTTPGDDFLSALLGRSLFAQRGGNSFDDLLHHIMMNESSYAHHGASEEAISRLERRTENLHELGECSISQEPFNENDTAIVLSCHHAFKENEILQWLRVNNTCPVCRVSIE